MHVCTCTHKRYMYTCRYDMLNQNYAHTLHRTLSHVTSSDSHYHVTHPMVKRNDPTHTYSFVKVHGPKMKGFAEMAVSKASRELVSPQPAPTATMPIPSLPVWWLLLNTARRLHRNLFPVLYLLKTSPRHTCPLPSTFGHTCPLLTFRPMFVPTPHLSTR